MQTHTAALTCLHHADKYIQARRKKLGSDSGKSFSEGWVEFLSKANAKQVRSVPVTPLPACLWASHLRLCRLQPC